MKINKMFASILAFSMVFMTMGIVTAEVGDSVSSDNWVVIDPIIPIPNPLPGENYVWTEEMTYEVGEAIDVFVYLPGGSNYIRYIEVVNIDDGKYYVFSPYVLCAMNSPGVYPVTWHQVTNFPYNVEYWENSYGIDITEQDYGTQVPEGTYRIDWYGASTYIVIGDGDLDIEDLPEEAFEPGAQNALESKFDVVEKLMDAGKYNIAINKLTKDILPFIENRVSDPDIQILLQNYANELIDICEENL